MALTALSEIVARWIHDLRWWRISRSLARYPRGSAMRKPTMAEVREWERQAAAQRRLMDKQDQA